MSLFSPVHAGLQVSACSGYALCTYKYTDNFRPVILLSNSTCIFSYGTGKQTTISLPARQYKLHLASRFQVRRLLVRKTLHYSKPRICRICQMNVN